MSGYCAAEVTLGGVSHGTFVGGFAAAGSTLNGTATCPEVDGAELVDLTIFPDEGNSILPEIVIVLITIPHLTGEDSNCTHVFRTHCLSLLS